MPFNAEDLDGALECQGPGPVRVLLKERLVLQRARELDDASPPWCHAYPLDEWEGHPPPYEMHVGQMHVRSVP